jgi:hypothetical protein
MSFRSRVESLPFFALPSEVRAFCSAASSASTKELHPPPRASIAIKASIIASLALLIFFTSSIWSELRSNLKDSLKRRSAKPSVELSQHLSHNSRCARNAPRKLQASWERRHPACFVLR